MTSRAKNELVRIGGAATEWVVGPLGERLTRDSLPRPDVGRWTPRMKAELVAAVSGGLIELSEACTRYALTIEEYASWQRNIERAGILGVRTTRTQMYRNIAERERRCQAEASLPAVDPLVPKGEAF